MILLIFLGEVPFKLRTKLAILDSPTHNFRINRKLLSAHNAVKKEDIHIKPEIEQYWSITP